MYIFCLGFCYFSEIPANNKIKAAVETSYCNEALIVGQVQRDCKYVKKKNENQQKKTQKAT